MADKQQLLAALKNAKARVARVKDKAEEAVASMAEIMRTPPEWGKGMPLSSKPEIMRRYGK